MLGFAALLDESIANAARFIIRRFAGRKIGPAPKVIVHPTPAESALAWLEASFPDAGKEFHVERGAARWHVEPGDAA